MTLKELKKVAAKALKDWCRERGHMMEPMLAYDAFEWLLSSADQEGDGDGRK